MRLEAHPSWYATCTTIAFLGSKKPLSNAIRIADFACGDKGVWFVAEVNVKDAFVRLRRVSVAELDELAVVVYPRARDAVESVNNLGVVPNPSII